MDVAESLFARQGYEATSLREITAEAGVNLAAVNYHFGGKAALLEAVYIRRITSINENRLNGLSKLEARHPHDAIPVHELVQAFVEPAVSTAESTAASGLLGRCYMEPARSIRQKVRALMAESWDVYLDAFENALGEGFNRAELRNRMSLMSGLLAFCMSDPDCPSPGAKDPDGVAAISPDLKHTLVSFLSSGMAAASVSEAEEVVNRPVYGLGHIA